MIYGPARIFKGSGSRLAEAGRCIRACQFGNWDWKWTEASAGEERKTESSRGHWRGDGPGGEGVRTQGGAVGKEGEWGQVLGAERRDLDLHQAGFSCQCWAQSLVGNLTDASVQVNYFQSVNRSDNFCFKVVAEWKQETVSRLADAWITSPIF